MYLCMRVFGALYDVREFIFMCAYKYEMGCICVCLSVWLNGVYVCMCMERAYR